MNAELRNPEQTVSPFIDSLLSDSQSERTIDVISPSSARRIFSIPAGSEADVNRAVASSRRAFDDGRWSEAEPSFRKKVLHRLAELIEAEAAVLDALDAGEMGKPVSVSFCNSAGAAGLMRYCAEAVDKISGEVVSSDRNSLVAQRKVPRGVVAAVVPWNFPLYCAVLKLAPALAAGNCVVLKPSEMSSRSAIRLAQLAAQAGLPDGVLNVVPGLGETVGRALGLHMDVDMVAFTGSTAVGKLMLQYSGQSNMKLVQAECGGKSPQIVFADGVDVTAAADSIAEFLLVNQGQICSVGSRLVVQRSIEAEMVEKITARLKQIVIGDALDPKTTFGPIASAVQCERVMRYIEAGESDGAQRVAGGHRVVRESGGYFVEPTVFRNVSPNSRIAREEIFGPVLSVIPFDTQAQAVQIANNTTYGLGAYIWTASLSTGMSMAKAVRCSAVINAVSPSGEGAGHAASFEPSRQSGIGVEGGLAGIETYLRRQAAWFNYA